MKVDPTDAFYTKRPWLTAMRDQSTGMVLALSLSFRSPNRNSCLSVLRDCSRRHGRLPETIVVDNGAEFHSSYFEIALARLGVSKQSRPPGCPRFGGTIESWFRSVKAFLYTQPGNTANDSRGRSASATHKGRKRTTWNLYALHAALEEFTFEYFNNQSSAESTESRSDLAKRSLAMYPESGQPAPFDDQLLAITAMPIKRKLSVDPARGVRHLNRWFSNPRLFDNRYQWKSLQASEEPWDKNRIYVQIDGEVVICHHGPSGRSELSKDFTSALDSILLMECPDVRSRQTKKKALEGAKLARKWAYTSRTMVAPRIEKTPTYSADTSLPPLAENITPYTNGKENS
ncbi:MULTISPECIES: hypothetical protein [unclassified Pseudoxanthomonas]|uniref:hypothetical protein n=1 Tax=unclassified Pseudoxanthomonas TaxID=2645906 RepID=UPI003077B352